MVDRIVSVRFLKYPMRLLNLLGLWRRDTNPYLYSIYGFCFLIFTQYFYVAFQIIYMVMVWGNIEEMAAASFLLLTQATLCLKVTFFIWNKNGIENLVKYMDEDVFYPKRESQWKFIEERVIVQNGEFFTFIVMAILTIGLWAIFPLIDAPGERILPIKAWYPMTMNITPNYELLYFYQIAAIWGSALINVSIDRMATAMTANGCAQVGILRDDLINIATYAHEDIMNIREKQTNTELQNINKLDIEKELDSMIRIRLIKCIHHHQNIVKFVKGVESNFHLGILAQIAASVGIICVTGLRITLMNPMSLNFVSIISYMIAMLAQIFFICRVGNDIIAVSDSLNTAAYFSPWIERKKYDNCVLFIFMERLKQPIIMRAGNFFPLSLGMFATILRSSYSYFAVLKQMNAE